MKAINEVKNIDINLNKTNSAVCKILNTDGELINKISVNSNTYTTLNNVTPNLIKAFVSIEDKSFFKHKGVNYKRIISALVKISEDPNELKNASKSTAHMYISSPFRDKKKTSLLSTHPATEDRIEALRNIK